MRGPVLIKHFYVRAREKFSPSTFGLEVRVKLKHVFGLGVRVKLLPGTLFGLGVKVEFSPSALGLGGIVHVHQHFWAGGVLQTLADHVLAEGDCNFSLSPLLRGMPNFH